MQVFNDGHLESAGAYDACPERADASAAAEGVHESEYVAHQPGRSVHVNVDDAGHAHGRVYAPVNRVYANVRGAQLNATKHRLP